MVAFVLWIAWIFGQAVWASVDSADPRKVLVTTVWIDLRDALPAAAIKGARSRFPLKWLNKKDHWSNDDNIQPLKDEK